MSSIPSSSAYDQPLHPLLTSYYLPIEKVGQGGFGHVFGVLRKGDGKRLAIKLIPKAKTPAHRMIRVRFGGAGIPATTAPGVAAYGDAVCSVPLEAYALRRVQHEGVIGFVDLFEDRTFFYLVQEAHGKRWRGGERDITSAMHGMNLYSGSSTPPSSPVSPFSPHFPRSSSDLFQCLEEHRMLPEHIARYIFSQVVETVEALLDCGLCHLDIKDQNILIDEKWKVKLIDFGAAMLFDHGSPESPVLQGLVGTRRFAAPEVLANEPYDATVSDVWSLGILLCTLLTGDSPFRDDKSVLDPSYPPIPRSKLSGQARNLMMRCLDRDVGKRINIHDILEHPWFDICTESDSGSDVSSEASGCPR